MFRGKFLETERRNLAFSYRDVFKLQLAKLGEHFPGHGEVRLAGHIYNELIIRKETDSEIYQALTYFLNQFRIIEGDNRVFWSGKDQSHPERYATSFGELVSIQLEHDDQDNASKYTLKDHTDSPEEMLIHAHKFLLGSETDNLALVKKWRTIQESIREEATKLDLIKATTENSTS